MVEIGSKKDSKLNNYFILNHKRQNKNQFSQKLVFGIMYLHCLYLIY